MRFLCIISLLLFLFSCGRPTEKSSRVSHEIYSPSHSSGFRIDGLADSSNSIVSVFNPWQGAKDVATSLLIVRDSLQVPDYNGQRIQGEAKRIVCMSSTHIAMLDALGAVDRIVAVSGKQYVSNPFIVASDIPDVGYEGNIDYETLAAVRPDLLLLFAVNGASTMEPKLRELGIPFLYVGDYVEETPLGKAEWIVPIAEAIGLREAGIEKFREIETRYDSIKSMVGGENLIRPSVMVNAPFLDSWFMPSSQSYVARMIDDAGADYIYKKNTGSASCPIDREEALSLISQADFWINTGTCRTKAELLASFPAFSSAACVRDSHIYNNNFKSLPGGGNDCYESGVVNPDLILRDMVKIFHPELVKDDFVYYHQLK